MSSLLTELQKKVDEAALALYEQELKDSPSEIAPCQEESFGHYQCNSAMKWAKLLRKSPREIATQISEKIEKNAFISSVEIAGPGFLNFTLDPNYLSKELDYLLRDPYLGIKRPKEPKRIIVEYSSPNIAKELHVGHLRSTIIGECLARLFTFLGEDVLRLNHVGDWGTQFGMLICYIKDEAPEVFVSQKQVDVATLMKWYKLSKKRFDEDPEFKKRAQMEVVKLQNREEDSIKAWEKICHISRLSFQEIYDLLDVQIQERGESFYNPYLSSMVEDLEKREIATESDGAKCIFIDGFFNRDNEPMPLMVQKSDGGFNYDTTDLAALRYRVQIDKADRIIIVVDMGQSLHFKLVFSAAEKAGYYDPKKVELNHVGFGLVLGNDGKKFKTRSGETEKLIDLLHEAIAHAKRLILERSNDMNVSEVDMLAKKLGIAAVKYADLSTQRQKDYHFSYDRMLRFEGNTALFLLYSFVRINGIKRKTNADMHNVLKHYQMKLKHPSEISLGLHLLRFSEIVEQIAKDLMPHRLCEYLYTLAEKFNAFFRDCRVEGSPEEKERLLLCEASARVLEKGLHILGIKTVDRL